MSGAGGALVDAHVHLHDVFDTRRFLEQASDRFAGWRRRLGLPAAGVDALMLTESSGAAGFERIATERLDGWRIAISVDEVLRASRSGSENEIDIVSGRQIAAREGLEVIALGTRATFDDGAPIRESIEAVRDAGALPVIPWGFGKWWGGRGKLVAALVDDAAPGELFLGDNGGRMIGTREPGLFARARSRGIWVLPGSDPLPFAREAARAGSYGLVLFDPPVGDTGWVDALRRLDAQPASFGVKTGPWTFLRNQLAMQAVKRRGRA